MAEPMRSTKRAVAFSISFAVITSFFWVPFLIVACNGNMPFNFTVFLVVLLILMLQFFLLYRLLSSLRVFSSITDPLDAFFYASRCGSFILTCLCVAWLIFECIGTVWAFYSAFIIGLHILEPAGEKEGQLGELVTKNGPVVERLLELLCLVSPVVLAASVVWTGYTGAKAFWGVVAPGRRSYQKVPLGPDEEEGDELDERKHSRS